MDDDKADGRGNWLRERSGVVIGIVGLFAWFALLWFMFGDVL